MSQDGFAAFMDAVTAPGAAVPALVEVFERPAPRDISPGELQPGGHRALTQHRRCCPNRNR
jgi:hypothetical protein